MKKSRRLVQLALIAALAACGGGGESEPPGAQTPPDTDSGAGPNPSPGPGAEPPDPAPSTGFRHPGLMVNKAQLDFIKYQVGRKASPWYAAFDKARTSTYASATYKAKPWSTVECGPSSNPNFGCSDERNDAAAAYTQALLWYITGNEAYARKSIEIMNAWSGTLTGGHINSNAPLQAGWTASLWPRAAEIIRHTYNGWPQADTERFANMLKKQYLPVLLPPQPNKNGNWELSMIQALISIAVFTDDRGLFDKAVARWRGRVPAYIYLESDGPTPVPPPGGNKDTAGELLKYWYYQQTLVDGLAQETCRDFGHTVWGIAAAVNTAEIALQQGLDLYKEQSKRLTAALEFHADYLLGRAAPAWLCGGSLSLGSIPAWEIAYNHFHHRLGMSLPLTASYIQKSIRPTGVNYFLAWETLTHAEVGTVGH